MDAICFDCETAPATREWDCGEIHARLIGVATIPLCGPCWTARDNAEPLEQADGYSDRAASTRDDMEFWRSEKR